MTLLLSIVIHTANLLGIFNDPFEFEGDYGPEVNPIRQKVFEQVVSKEALARNLTDAEIRELMQKNGVTEQSVKAYQDRLVMLAISKEKE